MAKSKHEIPKFSIIYADGTQYDGGGVDDEVVTLSFSKRWLEAPSGGVQIVLQENDLTGRNILKDGEYFYMLPLEEPHRGDIGITNKVTPIILQLGTIKWGGWTSDNAYASSLVKANKSTHCRPRSSTKPQSGLDEDGLE